LFANYDTQKYDPESHFEVPPVGKYRLRVEEAEQAVSKSGNPMIKVAMSISGFNGRIFHYFVDNEWLQRNIDPFFDSFGIKPGDFNIVNWRGKVGAGTIKHEMYQDEPQARIGYFIIRSKQADLPAWQEKDSVGSLREDPAFANGKPCPF
jgi:hypothetical protein